MTRTWGWRVSSCATISASWPSSPDKPSGPEFATQALKKSPNGGSQNNADPPRHNSAFAAHAPTYASVSM